MSEAADHSLVQRLHLVVVERGVLVHTLVAEVYLNNYEGFTKYLVGALACVLIAGCQRGSWTPSCPAIPRSR